MFVGLKFENGRLKAEVALVFAGHKRWLWLSTNMHHRFYRNLHTSNPRTFETCKSVVARSAKQWNFSFCLILENATQISKRQKGFAKCSHLRPSDDLQCHFDSHILFHSPKRAMSPMSCMKRPSSTCSRRLILGQSESPPTALVCASAPSLLHV